tara:strand:- start:7 stop:210 length:204 start_codon:yes stop_codon:yes gene_type:complete
MDYTLNHLRNFLLKHEALDISKLEVLCELPKDTIRHFLKDRRGVPLKHVERLENELLSYGYVPLTHE